MNYWTVDLNFIAISALAGYIGYFLPNTPLYLKLFPIFLTYTLINELVATYQVYHDAQTTEIYNVYVFIQFFFYTYLFYNFIKRKLIRQFILASQVVFFVLSALNILFFQKFSNYNSITYSLGCLEIVTLSIIYFLELFRLKKVVNLVREPAFWISTALLFYFTCSFPFIATANLLYKLPERILLSLQYVLTLINILLYSIFTIAFLCRIQIRKSTSSL